MSALPASVERVRAALEARDASVDIRQFDRSTRTAADAAATIGCTVDAIAKSLIFQSKPSGVPVLAIVSGVNRADEEALAALMAAKIDGETIGRADADFVRAQTGFAIGGVPPLGHDNPVVTAIDKDLMALETIWAAAGAPNAVFALTPRQLVDWTGGIVGKFATQ
ncbi:MAG: YbaK/EbsC family protein [Pseudomonadota bacterium]